MESTRDGLVRPVRLDPTGQAGPTRGQARNDGKWRRSSHGFFVPAHVDPTNVEQRILEASVVVPDGCAITGWAALRWRGARWFDGTDASGRPLPVTILNSTFDIAAQPGLALSGESASPSYIDNIDGVPVTSGTWSTVFLMRRASTPQRAVLACDMAAYDDLTSIDEVAELIVRQSGWTGVPQARWARDRACENAWSPAEVFMRLAWCADLGVPQPGANIAVFDLRGRHLGTPDLIDPVAGVVGEYDGPTHLHRRQRASDVSRDDLFRAHGLEVVRWIGGDSVGSFLTRLRSAYRRAGRRTQAPGWSIDLPPGWQPTHTVALRRALVGRDRDRLLRYRSA